MKIRQYFDEKIKKGEEIKYLDETQYGILKNYR